MSDSILASLKEIALLACCVDDEGGTGGLYVLNGSKFRALDHMSTMSATYSKGEFVRLMWSQQGGHAALVCYDCYGPLLFRRLDGDGDAHHIAVDRDGYLIASTATNSVLLLSRDLLPLDRWILPGKGDAWHVNGVVADGDRRLVCAFGRFSDHRGWFSSRSEAGVVFELETQADIITGLSAPHHPCLMDDRWVICDSGKDRVLICDRNGKISKELQLGGWTRGVAYNAKYLFVGVSAPRHEFNASSKTSQVAVIERSSLTVLEYFAVPAREIGDLCLVPKAILPGIAAKDLYNLLEV